MSKYLVNCPHCNSTFSIDENDTAQLASQIRNQEFEKEVERRVQEKIRVIEENHNLNMKLNIASVRDEVNYIATQEKIGLQSIIEKMEKENYVLKSQLENQKRDEEFSILKAIKKSEDEKHLLEMQLNSQKDAYEFRLREKDEQISFYKDFKAKMSTKMIGESLENHCAMQFETIRGALPKTIEFGKDNEISRTGSKGDFIYREWDEEGNEVISIMFEMKNQADQTVTKHKNEDFFKELDKDRQEKNCEYAVLVSLLELDNEIYNAGIYDVSHKYSKMYVVRPQCFLSIITILRNAAMNAMDYKRELALTKSANLDVSMFEEKLYEFKDSFGRNYRLAHSHFEKAIDEIDKTITHLKKVRDELVGSDRQLRIANDKVEEVSIKRLTKDNPTMLEKFKKIED